MPVTYRKIIHTIVLVAAVAVLSLPGTAAAVEKKEIPTDPGAMTIDMLVARPVGLVATVAGTGVFLVSLPFSALGGNTGEAWDSLVVTPAEYTFKRGLGDFGD